MQKLTTAAFVAFGVGAVIGGIATYFVATAIWRSALLTYVDFEVREHEKHALHAFVALEPEAALHAQEALARDLKNKFAANFVSADTYYRTVGMSKAREGVALLLLRKKSLADERLDEAVAMLRKVNEETPKEVLVSGLLKHRESAKQGPATKLK